MKTAVLKRFFFVLVVLVLCSCAKSGSPKLKSYCVDAAHRESGAVHESILKFFGAREMKVRDFSSGAQGMTGDEKQIVIRLESGELNSQSIFINLFDPAGSSFISVYGWHEWDHGVEQLLNQLNVRWWLPVDGVCTTLLGNDKDRRKRQDESGGT